MTTQATLRSTYLGDIEWDCGCELFLPAGLPGFENERRMIPVEVPVQRPLVFLQSLDNPDTCFVSLPVRTICPEFQLRLSDDDRSALLFEPERPLSIGGDVLCLALLVPYRNTVQANLDAPVVVNLHNQRCVQAMNAGGGFGYFRLADGGRWDPVC